MSLSKLCRFLLLVCRVRAGEKLQWGLTRKSVLPELTQHYKKKVSYKKKCQSIKRYSPFHQDSACQTGFNDLALFP